MKYFKNILFAALFMICTNLVKADDLSQNISDQPIEIKLFPNPIVNGEVLTIVAEKDIESLEILNIVGQKMITQNVEQTSNTRLNIGGLKEGIYFIKILFVDNTSSTKRLWVK
jgi:hypothetical protein